MSQLFEDIFRSLFDYNSIILLKKKKILSKDIGMRILAASSLKTADPSYRYDALERMIRSYFVAYSVAV